VKRDEEPEVDPLEETQENPALPGRSRARRRGWVIAAIILVALAAAMAIFG
jgi:hypothetical protein